MNGKNLLRVAALAVGLALATGPVMADANQALQNICATGCNNMANTMAGQRTSTSTTNSTEFGTRTESRTVPSYTPNEIRGFHRECLAGCKKK